MPLFPPFCYNTRLFDLDSLHRIAWYWRLGSAMTTKNLSTTIKRNLSTTIKRNLSTTIKRNLSTTIKKSLSTTIREEKTLIMAGKFKIGYLPLNKVNWTNDTFEAARADTIRFLNTLPDVEVLAHFLTFSRGIVPPMFAQRLKVPILLWSRPEPDSKGGRTTELTAFCRNLNIKMHLVK